MERALECDHRRSPAGEYERANLTAFSIASAPELKKPALTWPEIGASRASRSASSTYGSYGTIVKSVCAKRSSCSWAASTTFGCEWPTLRHADAAREVDEGVPVDVGEQCATCLVGDDGHVDESGAATARCLRSRIARERGPGISVRSAIARMVAMARQGTRGSAGATLRFVESTSSPTTRSAARLLAQRGGSGRDPVPETMALATATPDGRPSARMVLLKGAGRRRLHRSSRTARAARAASSRRTRAPHWSCTGSSSDARHGSRGPSSESTATRSRRTSRTRPRGSRLAARASPQSRPVAERRVELDRRFADEDARFPARTCRCRRPGPGTASCRHFVEFWQHHDDRLHDRIRYDREADGWRASGYSPEGSLSSRRQRLDRCSALRRSRGGSPWRPAGGRRRSAPWT